MHPPGRVPRYRSAVTVVERPFREFVWNVLRVVLRQPAQQCAPLSFQVERVSANHHTVIERRIAGRERLGVSRDLNQHSRQVAAGFMRSSWHRVTTSSPHCRRACSTVSPAAN